MEDDQQFCLRWNNHQSTLISVFDTLLENQTLVDCTLAAEGQFLKAHKVVLSACSPFFATLLQQQYDKHPIFILKDVKYQELRAMMDYMYRGEVNISQDQLAALLKAAESLQIKGLSDNRSGSTPKTEQHRGLNVPASGSGGKLSGYTLEQTQSKRPRVIPSSMETADISGSREGSSSPSRRRRKIRRRSIENTMSADVHDNSNSSQMNQPLQPQQQQPQSNVSLSGVGAISAASSSLPVPASALSSASSGVLAATGSIVSTQGTQQMTTNITKKTESVKGANDVMNSENIQVAGVAGTGEDHSAEHLKGEKSNHKQKSSTTGVATKETAEMVIEPKSEYEEEGNEGTVEDLTLDDEEMGMEDLDQNAGTSQAGEGSSQGYAPWQHDRSQDDLLMAQQEAQQRDPQGTSDGYWTILETVPYSLQNTATNTAGTINNVSNSHLPVHNQSMHQQDEGNSTEGNLIASATVVVEIPSESMGSAIKYTIPEAEHQLIHTTESPQRMGASSSKQRIHIVKDMRLNPTMTVSQQSTMARCNVEHPNRQSSTQQHSQQHFTLNDCLSGGVVVQQSHTERQQSAQQQTEFIKIESIQDKMMLRNVIQYDSVAVASSSMDVLPSDTSQVIDAMVGNEKQQHHHLQIQPSHAEVLRNTRQIELLDKATIQAVSGTVLDAFDQQIQERDGDDKSHNSDVDDKLVSLMRCPAKIVTATAAESGIQLQYVCNLCGKSYKIKGSLKRHKRYECGVAPTVACNFCPHKCKYKSDLRKHVTQKHSGHNSEEHLMDH